MPLFSRRQEIGLEDFCRDFYDNQILNPTVGNVNFGSNSYLFEEAGKERMGKAIRNSKKDTTLKQ